MQCHFDDSATPPKAEIWPLVFEAAFVQLKKERVPSGPGGFPGIWEGTSTEVWTAIFGSGGDYSSTVGKSDSQIAAEINAALQAGKMVVLGTKDILPAHQLPIPQPDLYEKQLTKNHAYPVLWSQAGEFELLNVHFGTKLARLPQSLLSELIDSIYIY